MHYFYQNLFLLVVVTCCKWNTFPISMKFHFKKRIFFFKHFFLLFLMCYIAHQLFIWTTTNLSFRIYFYIAPKRLQKSQLIFPLLSRVKWGETHFLVLAQTLIYQTI